MRASLEMSFRINGLPAPYHTDEFVSTLSTNLLKGALMAAMRGATQKGAPEVQQKALRRRERQKGPACGRNIGNEAKRLPPELQPYQ